MRLVQGVLIGLPMALALWVLIIVGGVYGFHQLHQSPPTHYASYAPSK